MGFLKRLRLGQLLGMAFASVIVCGVLGLLVARHYLGQIQTDINLLTRVRIGNLVYAGNIKDGVNVRARLARDAVFEEDQARIGLLMAEQLKVRDQITADIEALEKRLVNAEGREFVVRLKQARGPYVATMEKALDLASRNQDDAATAVLVSELPPKQAAYFKVLDDLARYQRDQADLVALRAEDSVTRATVLASVLAAAMAVLGIAVSVAITRSIVRKLGGEPAYAVRIAQQISDGDLSTAVKLRAGDGTSLLSSMESMRVKLAGIVGRVRQNSEAIATGANQISAGNTDLSQRTEEQAANLEETAASMEQMTSTVRQNAETVRATSSLAMQASETAERGGQAVDAVVRTMEEITRSSQKIGDIIGLIDSIAFQTNILALNAAVEAARAGEQGRGFAVVASEVRTLAQRSANAAREIKDLVEHSIGKVQLGSQTVDHAGRTINDVVEQVRRVATLIAEIGTATGEQEQGISQVGLAVSQLDEVTQQNAALVEEAAAAAESLNSQAAELVQLVSVFRIGHSRHDNPAAAAAPRVSRRVSPRLAHGAPKPGEAPAAQDWSSF
ncbi:hypothetical protein AD428_13600 [Achromobacter sp. DMS1]|uniref:methyl-accepting chemotaxis protein n=1 Tax=Achromobacter sp. DMS1 TaxID=1688405 RepID=UPI00069DA9B0|nr:methyl-accepting chemotaxis protein [Achromobacter sp. DMS1]KOF53436.1 hypothetical protein AD428_13600 [Achromobacter sp. DMS1]